MGIDFSLQREIAMRRVLKYQLGTFAVLILFGLIYAGNLANHWYWQCQYNKIRVGMSYNEVDELLGGRGYVNPDTKQTTLVRGHLLITVYFDVESGHLIGKKVEGEDLFWLPFPDPPPRQ
jgi:hypothetical protein